MNFELTRTENDEQLLAHLNAIKSAENIPALIPFAKAYLGMFYVINNELSAKEKVKLLANPELAGGIFCGFSASLGRDEFPTLEKIGYAKAEQQEYAEGYVLLAGLDLIARKSIADIKCLNSEIIEKAVGFHFSNKSGYPDIWFDYLLAEDREKIIPAIARYWGVMLKNKATYLPGSGLVLGDKPDLHITQYCILPLLENWTDCKEKTLAHLLYLAFKYSDAELLLKVCERALENDEALNEKTRLYWIAAAYLISPDIYFTRLSAYVGRLKLKAMPLLDFIALIMNDEDELNINFSTATVIQLLRMIAPIFPPQHNVYGALGQLDINSKNVMLLFYHLACSDNDDVVHEIKLLRKVRVMKIYSAVIDNLQELLSCKKKESDFLLPDFDSYIESLVSGDCLHGRSNKFDLR